jgi:tRNA-dihydrouridine synthase
MVGRAAVRQPWIFAEAKELAREDSHGGTEARRGEKEEGGKETGRNEGLGERNIEEIGIRFIELLNRYQPPEFHVSRAKRFFSFFCDNLKWGNFLKNQLNRENTLSGIEKVWREYFLTNS